MKNLYWIVFIILCIIPLAVAETEEQIITTEIRFNFDRIDNEEAIFTISGENLEWSKKIEFNHTIDYSTPLNKSFGFPKSFVEELPIIMLRTLGNITDVKYEIFKCNSMANFSNLWELCLKQRLNLELQIANDMINKTEHEEIESNLTKRLDKIEDTYTEYKRTKDTEITTLNEEVKKLKTHRQWGWGFAIVGIVVSLYVLNKYEGLGKRKHQAETEFPKDVSM